MTGYAVLFIVFVAALFTVALLMMWTDLGELADRQDLEDLLDKLWADGPDGSETGQPTRTTKSVGWRVDLESRSPRDAVSLPHDWDAA